ncbi:MAG: hypothetical protein OEM97_04980 [Acidimicrobiia bacterium]|nr:hypothetical protein [Acidimicrobiia bacterium]
MRTRIRTSPDLSHALVAAGLQISDDESDPLVLQLAEPGDEWDAVMDALRSAFVHSRFAAQNDAAIVYVVRGDDLLGRRGAGSAMVATGLLSGARTAAVEGRKRDVPVNVIAVDDDTDVAVAARWIVAALSGGPTGELIRIGGGHIGKALP